MTENQLIAEFSEGIILKCNPEAEGEFDLNPYYNGELITIFGVNSCKKCKNITKLNLSRTQIQIINVSAFQECTSLNTIILPQTLIKIDDNALAHTPIEALDLPDGIKVFVSGSVNQASSLLEINIKNNQNYVSEKGFLLDTDKTILYFCPRNVTSFDQIPHYQQITTIADCAFTKTKIVRFIGTPNLTTLILKAFHAMDEIVTIDISKTNIMNLPEHCFWGSNAINIFLPSCLTAIESQTFYLCRQLKMLVLYSNIMNIGNNAVRECDKLQKIFYFGTSDFSQISMICNYKNLGHPLKIFVTEFYQFTHFSQIPVINQWYRQELRTCDFKRYNHIPYSYVFISIATFTK